MPFICCLARKLKGLLPNACVLVLLIASTAYAAPTPVFVDGTLITLKSDIEKYAARCDSCLLDATMPSNVVIHTDSAGSSLAQFRVTNRANGKISLQANNGMYATRCENCVPSGVTTDFLMLANIDPDVVAAQFELAQLDNGKFTLRANNDKYVARCRDCVPGTKYSDNVTIHVDNPDDKEYAQWSIAVAGNSTYTAMYFHSQVQDATECALRLNGENQIEFSPTVTNPAATCPDAYGWKQLLDAVNQEFWTQWGNDETLWIESPKKLCTSNRSSDCCFVDAGSVPQVGYRDASGSIVKPINIGGPGKYCPHIPADYGGADETTFAGGKTQSSHNTTFLRTQDPGRIARQREVEVVYRNDSFVRYSTETELYSKAGLAKLFDKVAGEAANSKPHRPTGQGASYPPDAVMFKVDWIPEATMLELGYVADHDNNSATPPQNATDPYITMLINASTDGGTTFKEGYFYLVGITGASKALPRWHWYAYEHVANKGRCDYTGCNDSYGYKTKVTVNAPLSGSDGNPPVTMDLASNFIAPHTKGDHLFDQTVLFDPGRSYPTGDINTELAAIFNGLGIATDTKAVDWKLPSKTDPAWKSYRLKGTQTNFYNNDGYPTIVGASVTEGGFVNTASCLSCHVQASINANGDIGVPGVGATGRLNLSGIGTVVNGAPVVADYYDRGTTNQRAVKVDFVWGILFAQ